MVCYKIIKNGYVTDANYVYLKWQKKHNIMLVCDTAESQYICSSDGLTIWHGDWQNSEPEELAGKYPTITLAQNDTLYAVEIEKEEYDEIESQLSDGMEVEEEQEEIASESEDETEQVNVKSKLEQMIDALSSRIEALEAEYDSLYKTVYRTL